MNKILYHGGFATLGISLLLGMAVLQVNGRKPLEDVSAFEEPVSPPTAYSEPTPAAAVPEIAKEPVTPAPVFAAKHMPTPVMKKVRETIKPVALDTASAFSIFDATRKEMTKKTFSTTPNGIRSAFAYYRSLKHGTIQAQVNEGSWASISTNQFKKYVADAVGE